MRKLTGSDIITIVKSASKNPDVILEAQNLSVSDFDTDDITVRFFFNAFPEGFRSAGISDDALRQSLSETLEKIKKEVEGYSLRKAHNLLQNARCASNDAVKLDNVSLEKNQEPELISQIKSAKLVKFLSKYASGASNRQKLTLAYKEINEGSLEKASDYVRDVYNNIFPQPNVKTAFVTVKNQIGEGFQLCPKGIYASGRPIPMAISNCREYCIDARIHPDGTVGCNYLTWLNNNLTTQEQAKHLFDSIKVAHETMNLEKGQRTKFPMSDQNSLDTHIKRNDNLVNEPRETQLEKIHKTHTNDKAIKPKVVITDEAIEVLLKDYREVFEENELDNLESEIRKAMGE
jgi:hypothetical protein